MENIDFNELLSSPCIDIYVDNICLLDYREEIRKIDNTRRFDYFTNEIITLEEAVNRYGDKFNIITEPL